MIILTLLAVGISALTVKAPRRVTHAWLVLTLITPFWTVVNIDGQTITPSYLAVPVAIGLIIHKLTTSPSRLRFIDLMLTAAVMIVGLYQHIYDQQPFLFKNVAITLFCGYVIGRLADVELGRLIAIMGVVLAVWGIIEFAFSFHLFATWQAEHGGIGPALQERGGLTRSEASLGHAIAFGAFLVATLPFCRYLRHPFLAQICILAGVLTSLSRGPLIAAAVTLGIIFYSDRAPTRRLTAIAIFIVGFGAVWFALSSLYSGSAQNELDVSANARDTQLTGALHAVNVIGPATGTVWDPILGRYVVNGVSIVDSTYLRLALDFGWLVMVLLLAPFAVALIACIIRRSGPATIALAGQIPVVLVTSYITQWQTLIYLLAGMSMTEIFSRHETIRDDARGVSRKRVSPTTTFRQSAV